MLLANAAAYANQTTVWCPRNIFVHTYKLRNPEPRAPLPQTGCGDDDDNERCAIDLRMDVVQRDEAIRLLRQQDSTTPDIAVFEHPHFHLGTRERARDLAWEDMYKATTTAFAKLLPTKCPNVFLSSVLPPLDISSLNGGHIFTVYPHEKAARVPPLPGSWVAPRTNTYI